MSLTVRNASGGVAAGVSCTLSIASQPGDDASISPLSGTTDAAGVLRGNLSVGTTAGDVQVAATCGQLGASLVVRAGETVSPPSTGTGLADGLPGGSLAALALIGLALVSAGFVLRVHEPKRSGLDR